MSTYDSSSERTCQRVHAISWIFAYEPSMVNFFFNEARTGINWTSPGQMRRYAKGHFDNSQIALVELALDIWFGTRLSRTDDLLRGISPWLFEAVSMALALLVQNGGCDCPNCGHRLGEKIAFWPAESHPF